MSMGRGARAGRFAAALALAALLGPPAGATTISETRMSLLLPPGERPFWEPIARAFERRNPGVHLDLVEGPQSTDQREALYTASLLAREVAPR